MVQLLRLNLMKLQGTGKKQITVIQADMKMLPFDNSSFDIVATFDVVQHTLTGKVDNFPQAQETTQ